MAKPGHFDVVVSVLCRRWGWVWGGRSRVFFCCSAREMEAGDSWVSFPAGLWVVRAGRRGVLAAWEVDPAWERGLIGGYHQLGLRAVGSGQICICSLDRRPAVLTGAFAGVLWAIWQPEFQSDLVNAGCRRRLWLRRDEQSLDQPFLLQVCFLAAIFFSVFEFFCVDIVTGIALRVERRTVWVDQILWVDFWLVFAVLYFVIRVVFTPCILVLDLCSSRISTIYLVTRALGSPSMVFVTPIWPEVNFGAHFLRELMPIGKIRVIFTLCVLVLCRIRFSIPRMVFVTPMWPEFCFGTPFLREFIFIFPIWYSDTLQEIMLCKRIITVAGGFGPQSLVGDPILVVYSLGVFCNFNGFVCLFHGTSLFRDLYAVMDIVQFKD